MANLTQDEQETCFSIVASDRKLIHVFSDDPVWMARLDKIATFVRVTGEGKEYTLRDDQLVVRKGKKQMSEAQKAQMSERMRNMRRTLSTA